uniref:2-iminobutanoate/2-iminopropanoate deaminase n=1 Tax=Plectus sambesii TaxID=2011161 RepID=A0A914VH53_9BILA
MSGKVVRELIHSDKAPKAVGAYSQAVRANDTLYISGSLGLIPETGEMVTGGVEAECRQALTNMGHVLEAAGGTFNNVVKVTVLLADINDFAVMNNVYKEFFTKNYPARAAYQVANLPKSGRIEIEAIAVLGEIEEKQESPNRKRKHHI